LGHWDKAVQDLTKAVELAPGNPEYWHTHSRLKSSFGVALLDEKKYAEAESLLLDGYETMKKHEPEMSNKVRMSELLEPLVRLYDATGQKEKADPWRVKHQAAKRVDDLWEDLLASQEPRHRFIETKREGELTIVEQSQRYPVELKAGTTYVLDLESAAFDTYLVLADAHDSVVAQNDDITGGRLNSRLIYTAPTTATYRVMATFFGAGTGPIARGAYVLRIRELVESKER
jgi:hypothetical protein